MKNDVYLVECGSNRLPITQIALNEFRVLINPSRFSMSVGLWFQIIERSNPPAFIHEKIDYM